MPVRVRPRAPVLRRSVMASTEKHRFQLLCRNTPLEIGYLDSYPTREGSIPSASTMIYLTDKKRHLICFPYSLANLHKMAEELGIKRCWFHKDHYDIPIRRIAEIEAKCTIISSKEIVLIIKGKSNVETEE